MCMYGSIYTCIDLALAFSFGVCRAFRSLRACFVSSVLSEEARLFFVPDGDSLKTSTALARLRFLEILGKSTSSQFSG